MALDFSPVFQLASSSDPIAGLVTEALDVIDAAIRDYGKDKLSLSFNGGKDCTVLLHIYAAALYRYELSQQPTQQNGIDQPIPASTPIKSIYIPVPSPFQEMESFMLEASNEYHLDLFQAPPENSGMKNALDIYRLKYPEVEAILIGTRRTDPNGAKLSHQDPTDGDWPPYMRIHPIIDWNYQAIWRFLRTLNLSYCSLYDKGYTSLGSTYNTFPNPSLFKPPDDATTGSPSDSHQDSYLPAYELKDETQERCGRGTSSQVSQRKEHEKV